MDYTNFFAINHAYMCKLNQVDDEAQYPLGLSVQYSDGERILEAVYLNAGAGGIVEGALCQVTNSVVSPVPSVVGSGLAVVVATGVVTNNKYAWFISRGVVDIVATASTTIGQSVYLGSSAGASTPTKTVGKQVLGANYAETKAISGSGLVKCELNNPCLQGQTA